MEILFLFIILYFIISNTFSEDVSEDSVDVSELDAYILSESLEDR